MPAGFTLPGGGLIYKGKSYPNEAAILAEQQREKDVAQKEQLDLGRRTAQATPRGSTYAVGPAGDISFQGGEPTAETLVGPSSRTARGGDGGG